MSVTPPMGGQAPPLQCNRVVSGSLTAAHPDHCAKPATWHIIWTPDLENGLCCDEHYAEAKATWAFYAAHPYRPDCSMPGATFLVNENVCVVAEDALGLPALDVALEVSA